jgi:hypothetical protein
MKPSKMKDHLERINCDKNSKELDYFKALKAKFRSRPRLETFFKSPANADLEGGQKASYSIALNIAKKGKPYCIGEEVIVPALEEVIRNVMKTNPEPVLKSVPVSASTVKRRIDEMAHNMEKTLISELQCFKFSLQLDEATFGSSSVLMAYVRYFSPSLKCVTDEFFFSEYLESDSKGEIIFRCMEEYLPEQNISFENITAVATDGAPAMVATLLKQKVPHVVTVHCVLHRIHLIAKKLSGELHEALMICIRSINKIKAHPLNSRVFAKLCQKNVETANQLLMHTEVRWLSRGDSLQRLVDIFDSTVEFLGEVAPLLCYELKKCKKHLLYLADIYSKFNETQKRLQGRDVTIIQARTIILSFQVKFGLFKNSLDRRDYKYFSNLKHFSTSLMEDHSISDDDIEIITNHLGNPQNDFRFRFKDLENMTIPEWIITPFDVKFENLSVEPECEYELAELSVDIAAKAVFESRSLSDFWYNVNTRNKYPKLAAAAGPFLLAFPSTYGGSWLQSRQCDPQ